MDLNVHAMTIPVEVWRLELRKIGEGLLPPMMTTTVLQLKSYQVRICKCVLDSRKIQISQNTVFAFVKPAKELETPSKYSWNLSSCERKRGHTILQSCILNAKLSQQRFWHCYENGLIKTIQTISRNPYVSVKFTSLYILWINGVATSEFLGPD